VEGRGDLSGSDLMGATMPLFRMEGRSKRYGGVRALEKPI
jgi:hypothetical protein